MKHPFAIALDVGTSKLNHTGSWRTMRPEYVDRLPPCNAACPAKRSNARAMRSKHTSGSTERQYENTRTMRAPVRSAISNARSVRRG